MKRLFWFFLVCMITFILAYSETLTTFPDMVNPIELRIKGNYIYISDQYTVFVFNMTTFDLIKKFGNKGEGPEEFRTNPRISFTSNKLILYDSYKIIIYYKDFKFIKEIKLTSFTDRVIPVEDNLILINSRIIDNKKCRVFTLYNSELKKIKDLVIEMENESSKQFLINPWSRCRSWEDKVFIAQPNKGFYIDVFDKNGKKLYNIFKKVKNIKSEGKHKKLYMEEIRYFVGKELFQKAFRKGAFNKKMSEFVPPINNFWVFDNIIYIKTFDITNTKEKYIVMDLKGKILKEISLPKTYLEILTFNNNKFFYLIENEVDEEWVLHSIAL
jgi:hypothetical protein